MSVTVSSSVPVQLAMRLRCLEEPDAAMRHFQQWADQQEAHLLEEKEVVRQLQQQLELREVAAAEERRALDAARSRLEGDKHLLTDATTSVADALAKAAQAEAKARMVERAMVEAVSCARAVSHSLCGSLSGRL